MKFSCVSSIVCLALISKCIHVTVATLTRVEVGIDSNSTCGSYLRSYAVTIAQVVQCSAINARPFTVCEKCMDLYENSSKTYDEMIKSEESDGTKCRDLLLNSDKIQVVRKLNDAIDDVWGRSQCAGCYEEIVDDKGNITHVLSNWTKTFNRLVNITLECIKNNTNETFLAENVVRMGRNNKTVCELCAVNYDSLNKFYNSLGSSVNELCMDIVDKMNSTRIVWSKQLLCVPRHSRIWGAFLCTSMIGVLPFAFYFLLWLQADKQEHCVIPQKRLVALQRATIPLA